MYKCTTLKYLCKHSIFKHDLAYDEEILPHDLYKELKIDDIIYMESEKRYRLALQDEDFALFIFSHHDLNTLLGYYDKGKLEFFSHYDGTSLYQIHYALRQFSAEKVINVLEKHPKVRELFEQSEYLQTLLPPDYLENKKIFRDPLGCVL